MCAGKGVGAARGGLKNDASPPQLPNMHQGPADAEDWRPHLSRRRSNCIVGSLLSSARLALLSFSPTRCRSAAHTMLALMKPSDEVAITDFCHCHQGQWWRGGWRRRRRWRVAAAGGGGRCRTPEGSSCARCVALDGRVAKLLSEAAREPD